MAKPKKSLKKKVLKKGIQPIADRVLIREKLADAQEKTASGIIIPSTGDTGGGAKRGIVVAVGPGKYEEGKLISVSVSPGDTVLFQWGEKVVVDGEEYYLVREGEILAIVS